MEVTLTINDKKINIDIAQDEALLTTLRNLGYYSVRCGCETTNCGLCTVWLDGKTILSCAYPTFRAVGHSITTLEGLADEAAYLGECLASEGADQCGYCTTGMMMSAMALKREKEHPTDEDIKAFLKGNLCRCTGYESQLRGIRKYLRGDEV
ncbi:(2Fe-2S)-binding protein [Veillonella magna]|uniref:(2Fe-2S)-binding protein n=1 Tax=Veillonella magna TaxID=464322 RepID=UPI0023F39EDD|nr:2Fe-2S iron-sulfur cluster-binding protein [Veillonella magna]MBD8976334.1 (2Fe-2S)-binding protein [Veillonella magna]